MKVHLRIEGTYTPGDAKSGQALARELVAIVAKLLVRDPKREIPEWVGEVDVSFEVEGAA